MLQVVLPTPFEANIGRYQRRFAQTARYGRSVGKGPTDRPCSEPRIRAAAPVQLRSVRRAGEQSTTSVRAGLEDGLCQMVATTYSTAETALGPATSAVEFNFAGQQRARDV